MLRTEIENWEKNFSCVKAESLRRLLVTIYFYGLFFPVLKAWGFWSSKIVAFVSKSDNVLQLNEMFRIFGNSKLSSMSEKFWCHRLVENSGDIAVFLYRKNPQAETNIQRLIDAVAVGTIEGEEICALPIVCYSCIVPDAHRNDCFVVNIEDEVLKGISFSEENLSRIIDFSVENLEIFRWEISRYMEASSCQENSLKKVLLASAVIWKVFLTEMDGVTKAEAEFKEMVAAIEEYMKRDEDEKEMDGLESVFISLFLAKTQDENVQVYDRNAVDLEYFQSVKYVIFDELFYYIEERYFKNICEPLCRSVGIGAIKKYLCEEEILVPNNTIDGGYTVKVPLCFPYGNIERKRLLRLRRERIDKPGTPDLTVRKETKNRGKINFRTIARTECLPGSQLCESACDDFGNFGNGENR